MKGISANIEICDLDPCRNNPYDGGVYVFWAFPVFLKNIPIIIFEKSINQNKGLYRIRCDTIRRGAHARFCLSCAIKPTLLPRNAEITRTMRAVRIFRDRFFENEEFVPSQRTISLELEKPWASLFHGHTPRRSRIRVLLRNNDASRLRIIIAIFRFPVFCDTYYF